MKKTLLSIAVIAAAMCVNAQGTWKSTGTEALIAASTEISLAIPNLKCMHSDAGAAGVIGKGDTGATPVTYNGVTWDNAAMVQGGTNGMYFAFRPAKSGTLDISVKMGSAKKTFIVEVTDAAYTSVKATSGDLAALTTGFGTGDLFVADPTYFALPSVFDTYNNSKGTWNNSAAIQSTGGNVYMVMSFPVTANKTYAVGVTGSKLMLRGINYTVTTNASSIPGGSGFQVFPNPAYGKVNINVNEPSEIGIYSIAGSLMKQQIVSPSQNTVNISDLLSGVYFVKNMKNNETQKLVIQ